MEAAFGIDRGRHTSMGQKLSLELFDGYPAGGKGSPFSMNMSKASCQEFGQRTIVRKVEKKPTGLDS
jgi:hypothetical protein